MKYRLFALLGGCLLAVQLSYAQEIGQFRCPDGATYNNAIRITLPENSNPNMPPEAPVPYLMAVAGLDGAIPVLHVSAPQEQGEFSICTRQEGLGGILSANLPTTGEVLPSSNNTGFVTPFKSEFQLNIASINNTSAQYLLMIDGGYSAREDDEGDVYKIEITQSMIESQVPLTAYLLPLPMSEYDPQLTLVDETGSPRTDAEGNAITCDTAGDAAACYGTGENLEKVRVGGFRALQTPAGATSAMLSIPLTPEMVGTTLSLRADHRQTDGDYLLLLHVGSGQIAASAQSATLTQAEDGKNSVQCGNTAFENGIVIDLPALATEGTFRATALGLGEYDPLLAAVTAAGTGVCEDNTSAASTYGLLLPTLNVPPAPTAAQVVLPAETTRLVVGSRNSIPGTVAIVLQGWQVEGKNAAAPTPMPTATPAGQPTPTTSMMPTTIDGETFGITVTQPMVQATDYLTVYMIAAVNEMNPFLAQVDAAGAIALDSSGLPVACNDAGVPLLCQSRGLSLTGYRLNLEGERVLPGFTPDAMLQIPIMPELLNQTLQIVASSPDQRAAGEYVLVLIIVTR